MKKTILLFTFIAILFNQSFAMNPADMLNKISENFKPECYEYYNKIDKANIRNNSEDEQYMTYKVNIEKSSDLIITQG
jgi:hypothetical protein